MAKKIKNTKAAAAPGKDAAIPATDGGSGGAPAVPTRPVWVWRDFARYGTATLILVWFASFVFSTGAGCVRDWREFRRWQQEYRGDGGGETNPAPAEPLERWIRANLPTASAEEYAEVADVFDSVAEKLRSRALTGPRSACAETIAYLTPVAPPRVWVAFLRDLGDRVLRDGAETGDELADLWNRIAKAIRSGRAARASDALVRGALGFASPALSSPGGGEPPQGNIGPTGSDAGPSGSLAADSALSSVPEAAAGDIGPAVSAALGADGGSPTVAERAKDPEAGALPGGGEAEAEQGAGEGAEGEPGRGKDCASGNCPAGASGYGYNYGGWYWPGGWRW